MKIFKDSENNVFAYELDGSQDHLIGNKTSITQEEANTLNQAKQPAPLTPLEKLNSIGLTVDELKRLVG